MPANKFYLRIQDAAEFLGVSSKTLRRWEASGKLIPIRTRGNQRKYTRLQLENLLVKTHRPVISPIEPSHAELPTFFSQDRVLQNERHSLWTDTRPGLTQPAPMLSLPLLLLALALSAGVGFSGTTKPSPIKNDTRVLAATASNLTTDQYLSISIPATFKQNITAPNVIYSIKAGDGIGITTGQTPTIYTTQPGWKTIIAGGTSLTPATSSATLTFTAGSGISISGSGSTVTVAASGSDLNVSGWQYSGTNVFLKTLTNFVGIGTATPTHNLDVVGTFGVTGNAYLTSLTTGSIPYIGAAGLISQDNTNLFWDAANAVLEVNNVIVGGLNASSGVYTDANKQLTTTPPLTGSWGYWTRTGTTMTPLTNTDNIATLGSVGIGTTSPVYNLDVSGTGRFTGDLRLTGAFYDTAASAGGSGYYLQSNGTGTGWTALSAGNQLLPTGTEGQTLYNNAGIWTVNSNLFYDDVSTRVGIGTTNPTSLLTVAGDITTSGNLAVNGGNITSTSSTFNFVTAATTLNIGAATGNTTVNNTLNVTGTTYLNGIANIGDGGDVINLSGTAISLTANGAGNGITGHLVDNTANALNIQESTNNYINVDTTNAAENLSLGNATTNPTFSFLGSGTTTFNGNVNLATGKSLYLLPGIGKVGIGTTLPDAKLEVTGTVAGKALVIFNDTGTDQNILVASASGTPVFTLNRAGQIGLATWNGVTIGPTFGGTGQSTWTTGDILYASGTDTLARRSAGSVGQALVMVGGVPTWGTISGSICTDCLLTDPSVTQIITPTSATATGLSVAGASLGSVDIFNVTNFGGGTKYFYVNSNGAVTLANIKLPTGAHSGWVLTSDANGIGSWTDTTGTGSFGAWSLTGTTIYPNSTTYDLLLGSASTADVVGKFTISGTKIGKALAVFNDTGTDQNILVASASGTAVFIVDRGGNLTASGNVAVNGGALTTTAATFNLINTTATTLNIGGAATAVGIGNTSGTTTINNGLAVNNPSLSTNQTVFNLINTTATTLNIGGAATTLSLGAPTGNTTVNNTLNVTGTTYLNGIANIGDTGDAINLSGTTISLTANGTGNDITAHLVDNNTDAFNIQEGTNNYININTTNAAENITFGNATTNPKFIFAGSGNVGIGTTNPISMLSVGASSQFQVNSTGNIVLLNNVITSFPSSQGAAGSIMTNNGSGTLTWGSPSGTGTLGYWQRNGTFLAPANIGDSVGIGTTSPAYKLSIAMADQSGLEIINTGSSNKSWRLKPYGNDLRVTESGVGESLTFQAGGNVGIGTTSPLSTLNVAGTTGITWTGEGASSFGLVTIGTGGTSGGSLYVNTPSLSSSFQSGLGVTGSYGTPTKRSVVNVNAYGVWSPGGYGSDLAFSTTSDKTLNEVMRINMSGNVGIGTTNPISMLSVGASSQFQVNSTGNIVLLNNVITSFPGTQGAAGSVMTNNGSGTLAWGSPSGTGTLGYWQRNGTLLTPANIGDFVGIGTTGPDTKLHIYTSTAGSKVNLLTLQNHGATANTGSGILFKTYDNSSALITAYGNPASSVQGFLQLQTYNDAGNLNTGMLMDNTGNVGIGTTSPSDKLQVSGGNIILDANTYIGNNTYNNLILQPTTGASVLNASGDMRLNIDSNNNATGNYFEIATNVITATGGTSLMYIQDTGNVGIGTTNPISMLSVGASSQFQVNSTGNIVLLNNVITSFPSSQGAAGSVMTNNGSGTLAWSSPSGTGAIGYWTRTGTTLSPTTANDSLNITDTAMTTGNLSYFNSTSTGLTSGSLMALDWSPTGSTTIYGTGDLFSINAGQYGQAGNLLNIKDNGSSIFSVSQTVVTSNIPAAFNAAGDVSIAYDINLTNSTQSTIKSAGPMLIQAGEVFNSSNLTLGTYNTGNVVVDSQALIVNYAATVAGQLVVGTSTPTASSFGNFYLTNSATFGKALAILNQTEAQPIFVASASGVAKFLIDSTGNVGIGTTNPNSQLTIQNNQNASTGIGINNTSNGANAISVLNLTGDVASANLQVTSSGAAIAGSSRPTALLLYTSSATTGGIAIAARSASGYINFNTGGDSERMRIDASGNVGIGTTSPQALLHVSGGNTLIDGSQYPKISVATNNVAGTGDAAIYLSGSRNTGNNLSLGYINAYNNVGVGSTNVARLAFFRDGANDAGGFSFLTQATGGTLSEKVRIDSSGNVGIGTTNPISMLSVGASSQFQVNSTGNIVLLNNVITSFPSTQGAAGSVMTNNGSGTLTWGSPSGTGTLGYWTRTGTNLYNTNQSDNVGIGTTSPVYNVDIRYSANPSPGLSKVGLNVNAIYNGGTTSAVRAAYFGNFISDTAANNYDTIIGSTGEVYTGFDGVAATNWTGTATAVTGTIGYVNNKSSGVGIITTAEAGHFEVTKTGATAIIRNSYGLRVLGSLATGTDAGQTHNAYGLYIGNAVTASGGTTNNAYSIYSASTANSYFAGNVGIGTTSPVARLDVYGVNNNDAQIRMGNVGAAGAGLFAYSATPNHIFSLTRQTALVDLSISAYGGIGLSGGATAGANTGTYQVYINSTGNVGIGTTAPLSRFEVQNNLGQTSGEHILSYLGRTDAGSNVGGLYLGYYSNGTADTGGIMRSTGGLPLFLGTATNKQTVAILENGFVGIGTTTPGVKLEVVQAEPITSDAQLRTVNRLQLYDNDGGNAWSNGGPGLAFAYKAANIDTDIAAIYGTLTNVTSGGNGRLNFYTLTNGSLTEKMRLSATGGLALGSAYVGTDPGAGNMIIAGNVGIGTTNPISALSVGASSQFQVNSTGNIVLLNNVITSFPSGQGAAGSLMTNNGSGTLTWGSPSGTGTLGYWTRTGTNLYNTNQSDNVGIGTTNPLEKLHIVGTGADGANLRIEGDYGAGAGFTAGMEFNIGATTIDTIKSYERTADTYALDFQTFGSSALTTKMTILGGGNVGIGTTSPGANLQVVDASANDTIGGIVGETYNINSVAYGSFGANSRVGLVGSANYGTAVNLATNPLGTQYASAGVVGIGGGTSGSAYGIGVAGFGQSITNATSLTAGGKFLANASGNLNIKDSFYGVYSQADSTANTVGSDSAYGIYAAAAGEGTDITYGGYFNASGGTSNYGVYSSAATNYFSGNVGIGTTVPYTKLQIKGTDGALATYGSGILAVGSGDSSNSPHLMLGYDSATAVGYGWIGAVKSNTQWSDLVLNPVSGKVGIGTTTPTSKLQVTDTYNVYIGGSGLGTGANVYSDNTMYLGTSTANSVFLETANATRLQIGTTGDFNFNSGQIYLQQSNGDVGIGTTAPVSLLHLKSADPILTIQDTETGATAATATLRLAESNGTIDVDNYWDIKNQNINAWMGLAFAYNGSTKMAIDSNGNVGIGTTGPQAKLHVLGPDANGSYTSYTTATAIFGSTDDQQLRFYNDTTNNISAIQSNIYGGAATSLSLNPIGGNVGIGTTAPSQKLVVTADDATAYNADGGQLWLQGLTDPRYKLMFGMQTTGGYGFIQATQTGASAKNLVLQPGGSNVGIGTTNPISLTEIQGGLTTVGAVLTLGSEEPSTVVNDVLGRINFYAPLDAGGTDANAIAASIVAISEGTFSATSNATSLQFRTGASEIATTKMTILSNGNVGIGTTAPISKLQVTTNTTSLTGKAAAIFNQVEGGMDLITASAAGVPKFLVDNAGSIYMGNSTAIASANAVCWLATAVNGVNLYKLGDCTGTPADLAEFYPASPAVGLPEAGDVVTIGPTLGTYTTADGTTHQAFSVVKADKAYDQKLIGVVSTKAWQVMGKDVLEWADNAVPVALTGRVPVKIATSSAEIKSGDFLTSSTEPGMAMKATGDGYTLGKALEDWTPDSGKATILVFLNNSVNINDTLANATPSADLATRITNLEADILLLKNQQSLNKVTPAEFTVDTLTVNKEAILPDTLISGDLSATGNLSSLTGNLILTQGKVLGNSSFRGTETIPAGKDTIYIQRTWDTVPQSVTVTAGYDTTVWVENVTKNGFTIRVKNVPTTDNKIYWLGIW